jgi:putative MATE family efflux protein
VSPDDVSAIRTRPRAGSPSRTLRRLPDAAAPPAGGIRVALDRRFVALLCATAVPVALQSLMSTSRSVVDALLVSRLGTDEVAAIGYSSRVLFVVILATLGMADGGAVVVAQFWGSGNVAKARQATALTVVAAGAIALVAFLGCFVWAPRIVAFGTANPTVISLGAAYIRTVIPVIFPFAVISALAAGLRCVGQAKVAMRFALAGLVLHVTLAYGLIYGHAGLPALGFTGAAWATMVSGTAECLMFIAYVYGTRHPMAFGLRDVTAGVRNGILRKIRTVGAPVSLSSVSWASGILTYSILVGRAGTLELAVLSMITPIEAAAVAFANGVSTAASVLVGNSIGEGAKAARIWSISKALLIWSWGVAAVMAAALVSVGFWLGEIYAGVDPKVIHVAEQTTIALAIVFIFRATCMTLQNGLLRAGGDTVYILWADLSSQWLAAIPLTFLTALVWHWPFPLVFVAINSEEMVKAMMSGYRVSRRRWMRRIVDH